MVLPHYNIFAEELMVANWKLNHIDWTATSLAYNYTDAAQLTNDSIVIVNCINCKTQIQTKIISIRKKNGTYTPICKSCQQKRTWATNADFRSKQSLAQSKAMKNNWKNTDYRRNISTKASANSKVMWNNQQTRQTIIANLKEAHATIDGYTSSATKNLQTTDCKSKREISLSAIRATPEYHKILSASAKKACENLETKSLKAAISQSSEYRAKMSEAITKLWHNPEYAKQVLNNRRSKLEDTFAEFLDNIGVQYERQFTIGHWPFDFMIKASPKNILVEVHGEYWHGKKHDYDRPNDKAKATFIERYHSLEYDLKVLWEHQFLTPSSIIDTINMWFGTSPEPIEFELSDCTIKEIDAASSNIFLSRYHYTASGGRNGVKYGMFYNDNLIGVAKFCGPTRSESAKRLKISNFELCELTRFAIHPVYQKKNAASWFLSKCLKLLKRHKPHCKTVITFADETFGHTGTIYKASNWVFDGITEPDYSYMNNTGHIMHKRTLWGQAKKMGMPENDYATLNGYVAVWGKRKHRYLFRLNSHI